MRGILNLRKLTFAPEEWHVKSNKVNLLTAWNSLWKLKDEAIFPWEQSSGCYKASVVLSNEIMATEGSRVHSAITKRAFEHGRQVTTAWTFIWGPEYGAGVCNILRMSLSICFISSKNEKMTKHLNREADAATRQRPREARGSPKSRCVCEQ